MEHCNGLFKVVIIDTPPILPLSDFELISAACDGVVMVVSSASWATGNFAEDRRSARPKETARVVFNATDVTGKDYYGYGYGSGKS